MQEVQTQIGTVQHIIPIGGGMTNQNYKLETTSGNYVLRLPGAKTALLGIDRQAEFTCSSIAYGIGIGAEPIAFLAQHQAILMRFLENTETLTPESATKNLKAIVKTLKKLHAAPAFPKSFSVFQTILEYHELALEYQVKFPSDTNKILSQIQQIENLLEPSAIVTPCHNDLLPANILLNQQLYFIDWEYAGNGNQLFDLANLAANLELTDTAPLLEFYYDQVNPQKQLELHLMRFVSDAREAFWGFLQSGISSLEFDFLEYANTHLERFRQAMTRETIK